jgi:integration host factor subunit beta
MSERDRTDTSLTKSDLIELLARDQSHLAHKDVELAVKNLLEKMSGELASGERIEIRGFGSFSLHFRGARMGRNPKSGDAVALRGKYVPHFKPGKELRERVNVLAGDGKVRTSDDADDGDFNDATGEHGGEHGSEDQGESGS